MRTVKLFLFLFLLLSVVLGLAQTTNLQVTKSGDDALLNWSGGTVPYDVIKDTVPYFSTNPNLLLTGSSSTTTTDYGALTDGVNLEFYRVADATKPTIHIDSTTPPSPTTNRTIRVDGTYANADYIYVNEGQASFASGAFSADPVRLFLGDNIVTATATDAIGNVALDQKIITRNEGNVPPEIYFDPADGAIVYDDTPTLTVDFCDADGRATLNLADFFIQLDGSDVTTSFGSQTAVTCSGGIEGYAYTYTVTTPLANDNHFLSATVRDDHDYVTNGASNFFLSNPTIISLNPSGGSPGDTVTIDGEGFDPTPANNTVLFDTVSATVTVASTTELTVTVPDAAIQGPVTVTVNGRVSNAVEFTVYADTSLLDASSITYEEGNGSVWVGDRDATGGNDRIYEFIPPGAAWQKIARVNFNMPYISRDFDVDGNLYYANGLINSFNQGTIKYIKPNNSTATFRAAGAASTDPVYCRGLTVPTNVNNLVYFLDGNQGTVRKVPSGGLIDKNYGNTTFTFNDPAGAVLINNSDLIVSATTEIDRILPDETVTTVDTGYTAAAGIDWDGTHLLVADQGANTIILFDPTDPTTQKWTLTENLTAPRGVAFGGTGEIYVLEANRFFLLPKPGITLQAWDGGANYTIPANIYADYDPILQIDSPGSTFIVLEARLDPLTLIANDCPDPYPAKVTWTVEDPDDPSDDAQIDPNGPAGDDNVLPLGTDPKQWQQYDVYTMDEGSQSSALTVHTKIIDGISRVGLNMSGRPGENYRVTARVNIPVFNTLEAKTPVMTIWKKLWVEMDSMGECEGPMDPDDDDAVCSDIPQPDITFLANAFKVAYIDVFDAETFQAGQTTPDTRFKYHLSDNKDYLSQGGLARQLPNSYAGYWEVEIQGAYEDSKNLDNDPDGQSAYLGRYFSNGIDCWAFSYRETIRDMASFASIDDFYLIRRDILHEIGHFFKLDDASGGIMGTDPPSEPKMPHFTDCQMKIIRRCIDYPGPFNLIPAIETCTITCP